MRSARTRRSSDGQIDAYPEYTGTALLTFFGHEPAELPKDPQSAFREARRGFAKRGLVAFPPTPFTSSNEVAVTKETADELGLRTISDLGEQASRADDLRLARMPPEAGLPARAEGGLRAAVQALRAGRRSPSATRC